MPQASEAIVRVPMSIKNLCRVKSKMSSVPNEKNDQCLCGICLSEITPEVKDNYELDCGHIFHTSCIIHWFRVRSGGTCPQCRSTCQEGGDELETGNGDLQTFTSIHMSSQQLHKICARVIYKNPKQMTTWERALVSSYMACRRRLMRARSDPTPQSLPQAERMYCKTACKLLSYVMANDDITSIDINF